MKNKMQLVAFLSILFILFFGMSMVSAVDDASNDALSEGATVNDMQVKNDVGMDNNVTSNKEITKDDLNYNSSKLSEDESRISVTSYSELLSKLGSIRTTPDKPAIITLDGEDDTYIVSETLIINENINVTIKGNGKIIDANSILFASIVSGSSLVLSDLTITNAESTNGAIVNLGVFNGTNLTFSSNKANSFGGSIYSGGLLDLNNCTFVNSSVDEAHGGAIFALGTGTTTIDNCIFKNNTALKNNGGAIFSQDQNIVTINNSVFEGNSAPVGGAISTKTTIFILNSNFTSNVISSNQGGAIYVLTGGKATVSGSNFYRNYAKTTEGGALAGQGNTMINLTNSSFIENNATLGGAIFALSNCNLSVTGCNFTNNTATTNFGGAIAGQYNSRINISKSIFKNNSAVHGGAVGSYSALNISDCEFMGNNASMIAGAVMNFERSNMSIINTIFAENRVKEHGGALYVRYNISLKNVTFTSNSALAGGAIYEDKGLGLIIDECNFSQNNATEGGVIYAKNMVNITKSNFTNNTGYIGGAIRTYFAKFNVNDSYFVGNIATSKIYYEGGGAIFTSHSNTTLNNCVFTSNKGHYGSAINNHRDTANLPKSSSNLIIYNSTFINNTASTRGIISSVDGNVTVISSNFEDNMANNYSGAIDLDDSNATISSSNFTNNSAGNYGGAIRAIGGNIDVDNSTFVRNNATYGGAIITLSNANLTLNDSLFTENVAVYGGAVYTRNIYKINNSNFTNNIAGYGGAIITTIESTGNITTSLFTENKALYGGGAIYNRGNITTNNSTFENNKITTENTDETSYGGGAIYTTGRLTVNNTLFKENGNSEEDLSKSGDGGAITSTTDNITIINSTFESNVARYGGAVYIHSNTVTDDEDESAITETIINESKFTENKALIGGVVNTNALLLVNNSSFIDNEAGTGSVVSTSSNLTVINSTIITKEGSIESIVESLAKTSSDANISIDNLEYTTDIYDYDALVSEINYLNYNALDFDPVLTLTGTNYISTQSITFNGTNNVTINGNGKTINANSKQFLLIKSESIMTINNLTVTNAINDAVNGPVINSNGTLTIVSCTFEDNGAKGKFGGVIYTNGILNVISSIFKNNYAASGTIYLFTNAVVTINDSVFEYNNATGFGGAIANYGNLNVFNTTFNKNKAHIGGAIASHNSATIQNCSFIENTADYYGGAIEYQGNILNINNSTFKDNSGSSSVIYVSNENILFENSTIISEASSWINRNIDITNVSVNGFLVDNGVLGTNDLILNINDYSGLNNAITHLNEYNVNLNIFIILTGNSYIANTNITYSGSKDLTIEGNKNTIDVDGNQFLIINEGSTVVIKDLGVSGSSADNGGAIYNSGTLTVVNSTFTGNKAKYYGGAIYNKGKLFVLESVFMGNEVTTIEAAVRNDYGGGAIFTSGELYVNNSEFTSNVASHNDVETDTTAGNGGYGGAIQALNIRTNDITIANSTFTSNEARGGGAINILDNTRGNVRNIVITDNIFTENTALYGGAIQTYENALIENSTFTANTVKGQGSKENGVSRVPMGAAIVTPTQGNVAATITVKNVTFTDNEALGGGRSGAIHSEGTLNIENSTFTGNKATTGAIIFSRNTLNMKTSIITGNTATDGVIYIEKLDKTTTTTTLTNNTITGNDVGGSAIISHVDEIGSLTLSKNIINNNKYDNIISSKVTVSNDLDVTIVDINEVTGEVNDEISIDVVVTNDYTTVGSGNVSLMNGTTVLAKAKVDSKGKATIKYTFTTGFTGTLTVTYDGFNVFNNKTSDVEFEIEKLEATINTNDVYIEYGSNGTITAEVKYNDAGVEGIELTFVIENGDNDVELTATTGEDGKATFNYDSSLDAKEYTFTISFTDDVYTATYKTNTLTVTPVVSKTTVDDVTVTIIDNSIVIKATIENTNTSGVAVINSGVVTFTIDGVQYPDVTVENGVVELTIGAMINGTYTIKAVYTDSTSNIKTSEDTAVLTVTNLIINDYIEFKNIITQLNKYSGDAVLVIELNDATYTEDVAITYSGSKALTINGNGKTIDASGKQFLTVASGSSVTINSLIVEGAQAERGAAIINEGTLVISEDSKFNDNKATHYGGAIYNTGSLTLNKVAFTNNEVTADSTNDAYGGGAIYSTGLLTITSSNFTSNKANNGKESPDATGGFGGAIYAVADDKFTITESKFNTNIARDGGAIYVTATSNDGSTGKLSADETEVNIADSEFTGNKAVTGGAIEAATDVSVSETTFTSNTANTGSTIATSGEAVVELTSSKIDNVEIEDGEITIGESDITITSYADLVTVISNIESYQSDDITIKLETGTYTETNPITISSTKKITIDGNSQTINANNNQFITINENSSLTINELTLTNSNANENTTIINKGYLIILNTSITNSTAISIINNIGNLILNNSIIANNNVSNVMYNTGSSEFNNNFIENNTENIIINDEGIFTNNIHTTISNITNVTVARDEELLLNITLTSDIEGIIIRSGNVSLVDDENNIITTTTVRNDGTAVINYIFLDGFNKTFKIRYDGFNVYDDVISNEFNLVVRGLQSFITAEDITGITDENISVNALIKDNHGDNINKGTVKVYDSENNLITTINVTGGRAETNITFNQFYNDTLTLVFDEIGEYLYSNTTINAYIKTNTSIIKFDDVSVSFGDNTTITALLITDNSYIVSDANLSLIIDETVVASGSTVSGVIVFNYTTNIGVGNHTFSIVFEGTPIYEASSVEGTIEITQAISEVSVLNTNVKVGEDTTITAYVTNFLIPSIIINEGKVRFTIDESLTEDVDVVDGVAEYNITGGLIAGTYTVSVEYLGTDNITSFNTTGTLVVTKKDVQIEIISLIDNSTVGDENTLYIIVSSDSALIDGEINLTVNGNTVTLNLTNGMVDYSYNVTSAGNESIIVSFLGDDTYNTISSVVEFEVSKAVTSITVQTASTTLNNTVLLNASVKSGNKTVSEGNITFYVDDALVGVVNVANGEATTQYITSNVGNFTIRTVYGGSDNYIASNNTNTLVVTKVTPTIAVSPIQTIVGENTTILVYVFANGLNVNDGVITINSSVLNATANVTNGVATVTRTINNTYNGTLTVKYINSTIFNDANATTTLHVTKASTTIKANNITSTVNTQTTIRVNVTSTTTVNEGNVTVHDDNGKLLATGVVRNGTVNLTLGTTAFNSTYNSVLVVNYTGSTKFESSVTIVKANISRLNATINSVRTTTATVGSNINISVNIVDNNKTNVTSGYVQFVYNNTVLGTVNVVRGNASIVTKFTTTSNSVKINYVGGDKYTNASKTVTVNATRLNSTVRVGKITARIGDNITLTANVTDSLGNKISYGTVYFRINGTNIRYSNGTAVTSPVVNGTASAVYMVPSTWNGNASKFSTYYSSPVANTSSSISSNVTVNVTTRPVNVTFFTDSSSYYTGDTINVRVIITDNGALVNGGTVTFKFNGVTLKYSNGSAVQVAVKNGVASVSYTLPSNIGAGNHIFNIVFGGGIYQRYEATTKIAVLKTDVHVEVSPIIATGKTTTINARVYDGHNNAIRGITKVSIKIAGSTFVSNANITNGIIRFTVNTNFATGLYNVTISVGENSYYKGTKIDTKLLKT